MTRQASIYSISPPARHPHSGAVFGVCLCRPLPRTDVGVSVSESCWADSPKLLRWIKGPPVYSAQWYPEREQLTHCSFRKRVNPGIHDTMDSSPASGSQRACQGQNIIRFCQVRLPPERKQEQNKNKLRRTRGGGVVAQ